MAKNSSKGQLSGQTMYPSSVQEFLNSSKEGHLSHNSSVVNPSDPRSKTSCSHTQNKHAPKNNSWKDQNLSTRSRWRRNKSQEKAQNFPKPLKDLKFENDAETRKSMQRMLEVSINKK
mmetsp:Transcript_24664/g.24490  ORF Transcript_24664/g.24490 Transcript_24664/m.24490 type:complete len:118 (-) Transcript_24664:6-359(-)